ncbi:MAG: SH3 domain-containing protein [Vicingaceae bacterium]
MKSIISLLSIFLFLSSTISSQEVTSYYVPGSYLNFRTGPSTDTEVIEKLEQYTNVEFISVEGDWAKVRYDGNLGYVFKTYIEEGKALVHETSYRIGATCRDGSNSSATGRGACSHHGGVANWRYRTEKQVQIQK